MVRLVTAVIKPHRLEAVVEALQDTNVQGLTASEVRGFGRQGGHTETYRGTEYHALTSFLKSELKSWLMEPTRSEWWTA